MFFSKCQNCGAELIERGNEYVCEYCKRTYKDDSIQATYEKVRVAMQESLQGVLSEEILRKKNEQISNRRQSLYKARKSEFIDNEEVKYWSDEILKFLPSDAQATFYSLASTEKWTALNRFLAKLDGESVPYLIEDFVEFLTNGRLVSKCMLQTQDLIARTFAVGSEEYKNCQNMISEAVVRERSGIFDPCLPRDVFVAYSSKDKELVYELVEYLEDNGLTCFVAMRNLAKGVDAQRYYNKRLKEAIDNCQVFVFVSSKNSRTRNCDAYDIEMMYVKERDLLGSDNPNYYNNNYSAYLESYRERCKPRVEWLVDEYGNSVYERQVKQFFCGLTWCTDKESVLDAIAEHINNRPLIVTEKDKLSKENEALRAELERQKAELEKEQQEELSRQRAELEAQKAELEKKQQEELAKQIAEFEKQKAEFEKQKAELARKQAEIESEKAEIANAKAEQAKQPSPQEKKTESVSAQLPMTERSKTDDDKMTATVKEFVDVLREKAKEKLNEEAQTKAQVQAQAIEQSKAPKFTDKGLDYSIKSAKQSVESFEKELQEMRARQAQAQTNPVSTENKQSAAPATASKAQKSAKKSVPASPLSDFEIVNGVLKKYKGAGGEVVIPDGVKRIAKDAFYCNWKIETVKIPSDVTLIDYFAFNACSSLTNIEVSENNPNYKDIDGNLYTKDGKELKTYTAGKSAAKFIIPNSVTSIENSAFWQCKKLKSVVIPSSVTSIGDCVFTGCENLASIEVAEDNQNYKDIGGNLYTKDGTTLIQYAAGKSATEFAIPDSVTKIQDWAFGYCRSLTSVVIPNSVTSIGVAVFSRCKSLTNVVIPSSVTSIGSSAFGDCYSLASIEIPNSATSIGSFAFCGCESLTSAVIPNSVTSIDNWAFKGCVKLTIYAEAKSKPKGWYSVLTGVLKGSWNPDKRPVKWGYKPSAQKQTQAQTKAQAKTTPVSTENKQSAAPATASKAQKSAKKSVPASPVSDFEIVNGVLQKYKGAGGKVVIPDCVISIGTNAFHMKNSLQSVVIPDSVISIGCGAFTACSNLMDVEMGKGVTSIGTNAFVHCSNLMSITIPDSITSIGARAFGCCSKLMNIKVAEGNRNYKDIDGNLYSKDGKTLIQYAIYKTNTEFTVPNSVKVIGVNAFDSAKSLKKVLIPTSVTSIENQAFSMCYGLTKVFIPNSVTSVKSFAFHACKNLTIYAEASSKPKGWVHAIFDKYEKWNPDKRPVKWGAEKADFDKA